MSLKTSFAKVLRTIRGKRSLSQRDFASTSRTYLSKLEGGRSSITLDKLDQVSQGLGLSPLTLLTLTLAEESGKPSTELIANVHAEIKSLAWSNTEHCNEVAALADLSKKAASRRPSPPCSLQTELCFSAP